MSVVVFTSMLMTLDAVLVSCHCVGLLILCYGHFSSVNACAVIPQQLLIPTLVP